MPVYLLSDELYFPPVHLAMKEGLLAIGGDLSPERLLLAYKKGIFPWYSDGDPILWWSPNPRLVLFLDDLIVSRSLSKTLRKGIFHVTFDKDFSAVINACSKVQGPHRQGTWITGEMIDAYTKLHELGYAHSVEAWHNRKLVGGLYGVSLGRAFFGESMFYIKTDASKVALVHLRDFLQSRDFSFIDCQLPTDHLLRLGARKVEREVFLEKLSVSLKYPSLNKFWNLNS